MKLSGDCHEQKTKFLSLLLSYSIRAFFNQESPVWSHLLARFSASILFWLFWFDTWGIR